MKEKETKTIVKKRKKNINVSENSGDSESVIIENGVVYKAPRIIKDKEKPEKPVKNKSKKKSENTLSSV